MVQFSVTPSPSPEVSLSRYDPDRHPKFRWVFEEPEIGSPLYHLARDPREANHAVVLENRSGKPIVALRYGWTVKKEDGRISESVVGSDTYMIGEQAIVEANARQLLTASGSIDESMPERMQRKDCAIGIGGGARPGARDPWLDGDMELTFAIDLIVFADGEVAGIDLENYATDLQCRKPAAEFVAKQIRVAETENRDVIPVLAALAEMPILGTDPSAHWIQMYAQQCLGTDMRTTPFSADYRTIVDAVRRMSLTICIELAEGDRYAMQATRRDDGGDSKHPRGLSF